MGVQALESSVSQAAVSGAPAFPIRFYVRPFLYFKPSWEHTLREKFQTQLYARALSAKAEFKEARAAFKAGEIVTDLELIEANSERLALEVLNYSRADIIRPDASDEFLEQIIAKELVHPIASPAELRRLRLGEKGDNKDCIARLIDTQDGPQALAHVFRMHMELPMRDGHIAHRNFPGDIVWIRDSEVQAMQGDVNAYIYHAMTPQQVKRGGYNVSDMACVLAG